MSTQVIPGSGATRLLAVIPAIVAGLSALTGCGPAGEPPRPNIVLILADDLGYGDLGGYYGGKAKTPHLNRLAREGLLFTDFHSNGAMCSPTRAALMTGRYQHRMGIESALPTDWENRGLGSPETSNEITVAQHLRAADYATAVFGKWHLGKHPASNPIHHGFDEFRGLLCGCGDYFTRIDRDGYKDWWHDDRREREDGYTTTLITDHAVRYMEANRERPFFLYVAHLAIHFPWQTQEDGGLEVRRPGESFTSNDPGPRSKLGPHAPEATGAAVRRMIEELDRSVGRIVAKIRELGLERRTLVFFTSDNGGYLRYATQYTELSSNGPLRGQKTEVWEGGHRVPAIAWWPGRIEGGSLTDETALTMDLVPTFLELAGIGQPPADSPNSLDGVGLLRLLVRREALPLRTLFWRESGGARGKAARSGPWKLVVPRPDGAPELYNLAEDIGETRDRAAEEPGRVEALLAELAAWEHEAAGGKPLAGVR